MSRAVQLPPLGARKGQRRQAALEHGLQQLAAAKPPVPRRDECGGGAVTTDLQGRGDRAATARRQIHDTVADLRARRDMAESETRRRRGNETARARRRRQLRFGRGSHANLGQAAHLEDAARRFLPRDQI